MEKINNSNKSLYYLHISIILMSLSGVLSKVVTLPAVTVTFFRVLLSAATLLIVLKVKKVSIMLSGRDFPIAVISGAVLALHWVCFMQSMKVSTVAIGSVSFSTFPLFISVLEPLFFKERFKKSSLIQAVVIIIGVLITIEEFSLSNNMTLGIFFGMIGSFTYAVLSLLNRYLSKNYKSTVICFYEHLTAAVVLLPVFVYMKPAVSVKNFAIMVFYGVACTAIGFSLFVESLKHVKAITASIVSSLESVYGIIIAFIFLKEMPSIRVIAGGIVILLVVISESVKKAVREDN